MRSASESEHTAVGVGIYACGDPHRTGSLPSWVVETGMPAFFSSVAKPRVLTILNHRELYNGVIRDSARQPKRAIEMVALWRRIDAAAKRRPQAMIGVQIELSGGSTRF